MLSKRIFKKIKIGLCNINLANKIITDRSIKIHKKKLHQIEKKFDNKLIFHSPMNFRYLYKDLSDSCHIWGSGSTSEETKNFVKGTKNFFNIGFGFACLLGIDFDFYFIENASNKNKELLKTQNKALDNFLKKNTILVFKNLWQEKNDIDLAYSTYKNKALFIRDLIIPHYQMKDFVINNTVDELLLEDSYYFRGACSTVITSIIFAKYLGFKKIVLHGIDFQGSYFFDNDIYKQNYPDLIPPHVENVYDNKWRNNKKKHPTANCLEVILHKLSKRLNNNYKIELFSSTKVSGSSKYLKPFFDSKLEE